MAVALPVNDFDGDTVGVMDVLGDTAALKDALDVPDTEVDTLAVLLLLPLDVADTLAVSDGVTEAVAVWETHRRGSSSSAAARNTARQNQRDI